MNLSEHHLFGGLQLDTLSLADHEVCHQNLTFALNSWSTGTSIIEGCTVGVKFPAASFYVREENMNDPETLN
jgi:hypothetical protein